MHSYEHPIQELLRSQMQTYRINHGYSQERMAEKIHVTPRSYADQERGKCGFSSITLTYFLMLLSEEELTALFHAFHKLTEEGREKNGREHT